MHLATSSPRACPVRVSRACRVHSTPPRRATLLPGEFNHGYDDERGDYCVTVHDHLQYRYEVLGLCGKGSFGQVVHAYDHKAQRHVAIKVIRNKARFHKQALVELQVLSHLKEADTRDETNTVRMLDSCTFRQHLCIVFELLSSNLYEFMKSNAFMGVRMRPIAALACTPPLHPLVPPTPPTKPTRTRERSVPRPSEHAHPPAAAPWVASRWHFPPP